MMKFLALIYACLLCLVSQAQSSIADSLKRNIDNYPAQDTMRARAIYQYLRTTIYNSSNTEPYIKEMLMLSRKINYPYGIRKALIMYVKYYGDRADFSKSFSYADSLLVFTKNDSSYFAKRDRGIVYWDMANNYLKIGDYNKSIEYYFLSVKLFETFGDQNYLCSLYSNISEVYNKTADSVRSMEYTMKAVASAEATGDDDVKCFAQINYISELINRRQFQKAGRTLDEIEPLVEKLGNTSYSQHFFYNRGLVSRHYLKDLKTAIPYFKKSIHFARTNDDVHQITGVMKELFECLTIMNNLSEARLYLDSTLMLSEKAGLKSRKKEAYDGLAVWYEKKGDFRNSTVYLRKSIMLNDSILSEENNKQIASLEVRYQVAGKETEIQKLKAETELQQLSIRQKSILNYVLIGGALVLLVVSLLSYRNYRQKQKIQQQRITELETEKQLAAAEAVLKGEEQERTRLAKDLHDGLGGMLSGIKYSFNTMKGNLVMTPENHQAFERSMDMLDSSIKEMRRVAHNMMPEALVRFGLDTALRDYCNDINQSGALRVDYQSIGLEGENLDQTASITIYRIVQELITNTIKHAAAKTAIVQLSKSNARLAITIEDDGKGFDINVLKQSKGIGWTNIQHRVDFLKGTLDVSSQSGKGTSVHIEFNV
jgi:two-component system, NarL family, sensor kinase